MVPWNLHIATQILTVIIINVSFLHSHVQCILQGLAMPYYSVCLSAALPCPQWMIWSHSRELPVALPVSCSSRSVLMWRGPAWTWQIPVTQIIDIIDIIDYMLKLLVSPPLRESCRRDHSIILTCSRRVSSLLHSWHSAVSSWVGGASGPSQAAALPSTLTSNEEERVPACSPYAWTASTDGRISIITYI